MPAFRLHFLPGTKGNLKMLYNGYAYLKNNARNEKTYWLCARNRKCKCRARLITLDGTRELLVKNQLHNHEPEEPLHPMELRGGYMFKYTLAKEPFQFLRLD